MPRSHLLYPETRIVFATVRDMLHETLGRLEDVIEEGDRHRSLCPKCDAPERTCIVKAFDDGLGLKCESPPGRGCSAEEILAAIGLRPEDATLEEIGVPSKNGHGPDGSELLRKLAAYVRRYVVLTDEQAVLIALWIVHTHAIDAADTTPYLHIRSVEKRSGKTRLLEVLSLLVARAWLTGRVTAAVLIRKVAAEMPSLLLDESDAAFKGDKEYGETLRGVLNSGFRRGGVASLCVGQGAKLSYEDFAVFGAKAIAGIGRLPDTVADRSIPIELVRRKPGEAIERFRQRKVEPEAVPLQSAAAAWAEAHLEGLSKVEPDLPDELDDRAQDIIEPLLAIADTVGEEWPERARKAAVALLAGEEREDSESLGVRLLRDIRSVFGEAERLHTTTILEKLTSDDGAPWGSLRGEALDARGLARLLKPYGIHSKQVRVGEDNRKGYAREDFEDAWERYCPTPDSLAETAKYPADRAENPVSDGHYENPKRNRENLHGNADVSLVSDKRGAGDPAAVSASTTGGRWNFERR